ncbi:hypothetical protein [Streptomyces echinatus]
MGPDGRERPSDDGSGAAAVAAVEGDAFGQLGQAGGDAVAEGRAQGVGGEVAGDQGGAQVLVPVVDQPVGELLGPLAGLRRAEVVLEQQRAARQALQVTLVVEVPARAQAGLQVGGGDGFPAQADLDGQQAADRPVRLVRLAGAGWADDPQRGALCELLASPRLAPGAFGVGEI